MRSATVIFLLPGEVEERVLRINQAGQVALEPVASQDLARTTSGVLAIIGALVPFASKFGHHCALGAGDLSCAEVSVEAVVVILSEQGFMVTLHLEAGQLQVAGRETGEYPKKAARATEDVARHLARFVAENGRPCAFTVTKDPPDGVV